MGALRPTVQLGAVQVAPMEPCQREELLALRRRSRLEWRECETVLEALPAVQPAALRAPRKEAVAPCGSSGDDA